MLVFHMRGIKWSLRAIASMRAERLFLRARAVIIYVLRAASILKNTDGEHRALRKFSRRNLDLFKLKRNVFRQVILLTAFNHSQQFTANCQITSGSFAWASVRYNRWTSKEIQSFLIWHCEHITRRSFKSPHFQVLWHGRFLVILIFLGNLNNAALFVGTLRAAVSMIGKPIAWK